LETETKTRRPRPKSLGEVRVRVRQFPQLFPPKHSWVCHCDSRLLLLPANSSVSPVRILTFGLEGISSVITEIWTLTLALGVGKGLFYQILSWEEILTGDKEIP
jgi:hypothetical protein